MHTPIKIIVVASLLLLSGNAAAIIMNDNLYGSSAYSLDDIHVGIQAFQDDVSSRKEKRRLKKALRLDRKIEKLIDKIDEAMLSDKIRKMQRKNRKLGRKEVKLLAILAGYLPDLDDLDEFLQNGDMPTAGDFPPPEPDILLPTLEIVIPPEASDPDSNTSHGTTRTFGDSPNETASIPEPSILALLGLGFAGLMFTGRKRIKGVTE